MQANRTPGTPTIEIMLGRNRRSARSGTHFLGESLAIEFIALAADNLCVSALEDRGAGVEALDAQGEVALVGCAEKLLDQH